jgi:hypothetical protein
MAGEVKTKGPGTGRTCYFVVRGSGNAVWSTAGAAFEVFTSGNWADYDVALVEQGVSNVYVGNMPSAVPPGVFDIDARQQVGGGPVQTDPVIAAGEVQWNGLKTVPLSDLVTSGMLSQIGPLRIARGVMVPNFPIYLKSAADHITPLVSGTLSGQISKNGGQFGPLQSGAFSEIGLGFYSLQSLTSGDLLADTVALLFTGVSPGGGGSDPLAMSFVTQRVSGSV